MHSITRLLGLALPLAVLGPLLAPTQDEPSSVIATRAAAAPKHPRVIWTSDPSSSATVSWTTDVAVTDAHVMLWTEGGEPWRYDSDRDEQLIRGEKDGDDVLDTWVHHVRLTGLEQGTVHHLRLVSGGIASPDFWFRTAPTADEPYSLLYGGDARSGWEDRVRMNKLIAELAGEGSGVLAFLHGGDYMYDGRKLGLWRTWLEHGDATIAEDGRLLPIVPVRGNHDGGPIYDQLWDTPGGEGRNWFTTSLPLGLELVTLNTNIAHGGDQLDWLRDELAERRPQARWLLCQYHRPAFPAVKSAGSARWSWVPSFEEFDVDLVFESDGHVYKRTLPIRDESHDETGVVYVGEGGLGVPQRMPRERRWYLQEPGLTRRAHHVTKLTVGADALEIRSYGFPVDAESGRLGEGEHEAVLLDEARIEQRAGYPVAVEPAGDEESGEGE